MYKGSYHVHPQLMSVNITLFTSGAQSPSGFGNKTVNTRKATMFSLSFSDFIFFIAELKRRCLKALAASPKTDVTQYCLSDFKS